MSPSKRALTTVPLKVAKLLMVAVLVLGSGALWACSPQAKEAIHLTIKVPRTGHDVVFDNTTTQIDQVIERMARSFEESYEGTPVDVDVEVFEQNQYDEAIEEVLGTEDSPDILYGDFFNISTYIHSGTVVPLDDVADKGIREDLFPHLLTMSTVNGRLYMMPYLSRQNVLAYNKELFIQAGLEEYIEEDAITSWTLEEWTTILDTLALNLPEAVYPMMMYAGSSQGDTHIMTLLRSAGSRFFDEDDHFQLNTPAGIAALRWIQEGVDRGWFPPHAENLEIEDCSSLFREGQLAIYMVNNASLGRYGDSIGLVNFPGSGSGCATTFISGFEVFDNGDPEKVQVAKDFLAYVYQNEELMDLSAGALPASQSVAKRYGDDILAFNLFSKNRKNVVDFTGNNPDTRAVREIFHRHIHDLLTGALTPEEAAAALDEQCNAAIEEGKATSQLHE